MLAHKGTFHYLIVNSLRLTLETNEKTTRIGLSITPIMSSIHKSKENNKNKVDMKKKGNQQASAAGSLAGGSVDCTYFPVVTRET